jgi:prepilin-type N-terminal cleavage/methylation domain-containing protein
VNERGQRRRGFTLIELLIIMVVLGILAAVVIFALGGLGPAKHKALRGERRPGSSDVLVAPMVPLHNKWGGLDVLKITNYAKVSSLKITIEVELSGNVRYRSVLNSYPQEYLTEGSSVVGGSLDYVFTLAPGTVIPAGFVDGEIGAQYYSGPAVHDVRGDYWSVTSTSKGKTSTVSGSF